MGLAETALLAVDLHLTGASAYTAGIARAEAATATFGKTAASGLSGGLAKAEAGLSKFSGAVGKVGSRIGGLVTGPLGLIGLSAGLLSVGGAIKEGITKAEAFGETVDRLISVTGQGVETVSELVSAFDYFGVSGETTLKVLSMAEKNLGLLTSTTSKAKDFTKAYGLSLVDAQGHVKDMNTLILDSADFFNNKLIPASTKAAALSKVFGRNWQELVEVFEKGAPAIRAAEQQAKDLGLTLSGANLDDLLKFRDASRELNTAMGGLELQVGLALIPAFTDLSKSVSSFVRDNRAGIVQFFKDAAANVGKFGDFISKDVIPPLRMLGSAAKAAWNAVPEPLKQILIGGVIANKAGKFLFDISIKDAAGGAFDLGKSLLGKGGNPANPLFVKDVGGINLPGIGGAAAAGEGAAAIGGAGLAVSAGALALAVSPIIYGIVKQAQYKPGDPTSALMGKYRPLQFTGPYANGPTSGGLSPDDRQAASDAMRAGMQSFADRVTGDLGSIDRQGKEFVASLRANTAALHRTASLLADKNWLAGLAKGIHERSVGKFGGSGRGSAAETATYQRDILGKAASIVRHGAGSVERLERLKQLLRDAKNATDATKRTLSADIKSLKSTIGKQKPPVVTVNVRTNVEVTANSVTKAITKVARWGASTPNGPRIYEP